MQWVLSAAHNRSHEGCKEPCRTPTATLHPHKRASNECRQKHMHITNAGQQERSLEV